MKNESKVITTASLSAVTDWDSKDRGTIYAGDIRHPWKSVYGFTMTAAQLAAGQELILHCRNDEIDGFLTQLNNLLSACQEITSHFFYYYPPYIPFTNAKLITDKCLNTRRA